MALDIFISLLIMVVVMALLDDAVSLIALGFVYVLTVFYRASMFNIPTGMDDLTVLSLSGISLITWAKATVTAAQEKVI